MREQRTVDAHFLCATAVLAAAAVGCSPSVAYSSSGSLSESSGDAAETSTAPSNSGTNTTSTAEGATPPDGTSGTTDDLECVDNIANEPWCYRMLTVAGTARSGPYGRFGPGGAPRFFIFSGLEAPSLLGWDGTAVVVEPQPHLARADEVLLDAYSLRSTNGSAPGYDDVARFSGPATTLGRYVATNEWISGPTLQTFAGDQLRPPWTPADVNGDGVDEIVVGEPGDTSLGVWPRLLVMEWTGDGFEVLGEPVAYNLQSCGSGGLGIAVIDVDGDPYEDLLVSTDCKQPGFLGQMYVVRGAPEVDEMQSIGAGLSPHTADDLDIWAQSIAARDFDGDGLTDLALVSSYQDLFTMRGLGDGEWAQASALWVAGFVGEVKPDGVDGANGWEWRFADIDGNGATEILAGRTVVLDPLGQPEFTEYLPFGAIPRIAIFAAAGDISGDGTDDLVFTTDDDTTRVLISGAH